MKQDELRRELIEHQGGQSDYEFARLLDVSVSTWRHTRTGRRPIRRRIAMAAYRAYPRLRKLILEALVESGEPPVEGADGEAA